MSRSQFKVVIIGAGPGGICAAIKLREAGIDDFIVLEKAGGIGGTWWHNRYPGAECDVPSHLYSFSFEQKRDWSRPYARQPEILEYMRHVVDKYELMPYVRVNSKVEEARWNEASHKWQLQIDGSAEMLEGQFLISGVGMFTELTYPDIGGVEDFEGTKFHTGSWLDGHDLSGEKVAVIGSAASAVQMIPEIADEVDQLFVYQRRAQWVLPKEDEAFSQEQIRAFVEDDEVAATQRASIRDGLENFITFSNKEVLEKAEVRGLENLAVVEDLETRRKLTPDMAYGCRRPLSSNLYYPVFNRDHVSLITDAVECLTPEGVSAGGQENRVDTVIFATGFQTTRYLSCVDVYGKDGLNIKEAWQDGAQAYLGVTTAGFPNLFMLYGPNTNNGSILEMLEHQVEYSVRQIKSVDERGDAWLSLKSEKMGTYNASLQHDIEAVDVWQGTCGGYYRGNAGFIVTQWPHTMDRYKAWLDQDSDSFNYG